MYFSSLKILAMRLNPSLRGPLLPLVSRLSMPVLGKSPKVVTADVAVSNISSVFVHGLASTPTELLEALCRRVDRDELKNIRLMHLLLNGHVPVTNKKYIGEVLRYADYIPIFLSDMPSYFYDNSFPVDVALMSVSSPDKHGFCTLGVNVDTAKAALEMAKKVIGLFFFAIIHPTSTRSIGAIPDSTLISMKQHKDLGIHTEMLGHNVVDLIELGVVNNTKKTVMPGRVVTSFAFGTQKFYEYLHDNSMFHFDCCGWTNRAEVIRSNSRMTSINSGIEIDITGQVASDSIGTALYSGFGGQTDFVTATPTAYDGLGKSIIALPSRTSKGQARITVALTTGAGVVTTRGHTRYVVTEQGIASLGGKNVRQRAYELIKIAHPDDREQLEKASFERLKCMPSPD
uniref:Acetyl-CoA hydrolase n=1 Tax=Angiostrongylus cantonensis TaxID=6313 RepID=A0A0K0CZ37_ANGCA